MMKLMIRQIQRQLPPLLSTDEEGEDPLCPVRYYHPLSGEAWSTTRQKDASSGW